MNTRCLHSLAAALALPCAAAVHAADWTPHAVFVEGAVAEHETRALTVGAAWPWDVKRPFGRCQLTVNTEVFLSHWSTQRVGGGRDAFTQVGLVPIFRLGIEGGRSPWFLEGGIGLTLTDSLYYTPQRTFSTRFNFIDVFGFGRSLDAARKHEISLRVAHISNANLKRPNPGENFLQVRYTAKF